MFARHAQQQVMRQRPFYFPYLSHRFDLVLASGFILVAFVAHGSELGRDVLAWVGAIIASLLMFSVVWVAPVAGEKTGAVVAMILLGLLVYHSKRVAVGMLTYLAMGAFVCAGRVKKLAERVRRITWVWLTRAMFQRTAVPYERFPFTMCLLIY
jgi:hypothetical protein